MSPILDLPMTYLLLAGDVLVMGFMVVVVAWASLRASEEQIDAAARIPLRDEYEPPIVSGTRGSQGEAE
jgi:hypothetical protein